MPGPTFERLANDPAPGLELMVRAQQAGCRIGDSPLYVEVLERVAKDLEQFGPCHTVLDRFRHETFRDAMVLRFLAAVHELVLTGRAEDLAAHYPSAGGSPGPDLGDVFVATVAEHADELVERTRAPIQTNEVGRAAALLGGFLIVARSTGLPLRLLEVGASAGLNLRFDQYRYATDGGTFGPPNSPVRIVDPWIDSRPDLDLIVDVADRRGCDVRPLDPTDPTDQLRLRACLWPDQPDRRARLDGALVVAATVPATVEEAGAAEWVADQLAERAPGWASVVFHSIVIQYLPVETRRAMKAAVVSAGQAATPDAPVAWLSMEPATVEEAEVRLTLWPGDGRTRSLALCGFHGPPVRWHAG